jgi:hypothetical protein
LADIGDPRLLRFNLATNRGPYFANAIALEATHDSLLLVQDADDVSVPHRLESLLRIMRRDASTFAFSTLGQFHDDRSKGLVLDPPLYSTAPSIPPGPELESRIPHHGLYSVCALTEKFLYRAPHHGLVRVAALRRVGGYYGGFRIGWDTLLTNLILMTGSIGWTPEPLYYRLIRCDSLTHSAETGTESEYALRVSRCLRRLYDDCYGFYTRFRAGEIDHNRLLQGIRWASQRYVTQEQAVELHKQASRLRQVLARGVSHD